MITIDTRNPPPFVVTVVMPWGQDVTWPHDSRESAENAYHAAVSSGQFTRTLRKATKKRPASTVTMVGFWQRETDPDDGHIHYTMEAIS